MPVTIKGSGQVPVQVVQATTSTPTATTSASYVNTSLTASITPTSSSNRILILVSGVLQTQADNSTSAALGIKRDSTVVYDDQRAMNNAVNANIRMATRANLIYLDTPSTTSLTTYTVVLARSVTAGTSYSAEFPPNTSVATIILMELAYA